MAVQTDKNSYTVIFAAVMVVIVGSILAFTSSSLEGKIAENQRFEKQQNILYAMGVNDNVDEANVNFIPTDKVQDVFKTYIKEQLVIDGDKITEDDEAYLIDMKKQIAIAEKGGKPKLPLMIGEKDGKKFYIIPLYGKGLWDAIWGFITLDDKMVVEGVYFDHKGETPGLGANLNQRYFMDDFTGETILKGNDYAGVKAAKGNNDPLNKDKEDNKVDALAGATITSNGINAMIKESIELYKDYLQTIRAK
ncbi:Na(+)-translocating NADH-quinone reductase subunit C [Zobellia sp.]|nr:Na(+)-translocating NADH-quinone reductase subunit C [Zobellia sp.]